jgi:hypothetical protein
MTSNDLVRLRLARQHLARPAFRSPLDVVSWLGAVQSQDYPSARWAIGLRARTLRDADVEHAFDAGTIVRTHVLRPTWHFVAPADIRWMLALTGPRVQAITRNYHRRLGIDGPMLARACDTFARAVEGGRHLTRAELVAVLRRARLPAEPLQTMFLVMHAELEGILCSGPRSGKQFTYALLDERVARTRPLDRDEAVAELTRRYFTSHGPATSRDFAWWSGLTQRDARAGLEMNRATLDSASVDRLTYWFAPAPTLRRVATTPRAWLLPNYDEYLVAYQDRGLTAGPAPTGRAGPPTPHSIVIDGRLAGGWRRVVTKDAIRLGLAPSRRLTSAESDALAGAVERYGSFVGRKVVAEDGRHGGGLPSR